MTADESRRAQQHSDASFREYGCRIDRDLLNRIIAASQNGFSPEAVVSVSTKRESGGISSKISAESVEQLLVGLRESTAAGDPNWTDNLNIRAFQGNWNGLEERSVTVDIDTDRVWVTVSGDDAGWVRGRVGELQDLIRYSRARWVVSPAMRYGITGGAFAFYVITATIVLILQITHARLIYPVLNGVLIVLYLSFFFANRKLKSQAQTRIAFLPTSPPERKDWVAVATLVATILILIATVVGVIYAAKG